MENVLSKKGTNMKGKQVDFLYSLLFFCVHVCHVCATPKQDKSGYGVSWSGLSEICPDHWILPHLRDLCSSSSLQ